MADNTTTSYLSGLMDQANTIQSTLAAKQKLTDTYKKAQPNTGIVYAPRKTNMLYTESSRQNTRTSPYQSLLDNAKTHDQFAYGSSTQAKNPLVEFNDYINNNNNQYNLNIAKWQANKDAMWEQRKHYGMSAVQWDWVVTNMTNALARNSELKTSSDHLYTSFTDIVGKDFTKLTKEQLATLDFTGVNKLLEETKAAQNSQNLYLDLVTAIQDGKTWSTPNLELGYNNFATQFGTQASNGMGSISSEFYKALQSTGSIIDSKQQTKQSIIDLLESYKLNKLQKEGKIKPVVQQDQSPNNIKQQIIDRMSRTKALSTNTSANKPVPISPTRPM